MSISSNTSPEGTEDPSATDTGLIPIRRRTTSEMGELFDYMQGPPGNTLMNSSIEAPETDTGIYTSKDCDFEFIMSGDSFHPIMIYCETHNKRGTISW